jgi:hypothetical protein
MRREKNFFFSWQQHTDQDKDTVFYTDINSHGIKCKNIGCEKNKKELERKFVQFNTYVHVAVFSLSYDDFETKSK